MRIPTIILLSIFGLFATARALETVSPDLVANILTTDEGATHYITTFLQGIDPRAMLMQNSVFIEKVSHRNGDQFFVAKALINLPSGNGRYQEVVCGIILDVTRDWTVRVSESDYNQFLRTGDRAILAEPNLNPDLPQSTPEHYRRSDEGHEDTSPLDESQFVAHKGERYPQTRLFVMSSKEIAGMSITQLRYAINEVYARYGATFPQVPEIQRQFLRFDWYHPNPRLSFVEDIDQMMSDIESQNVKMMALYREGIRNK
jgi:hypothetical protein